MQRFDVPLLPAFVDVELIKGMAMRNKLITEVKKVLSAWYADNQDVYSEFREMVDNIRNAEKALGEVKYDITDRQRQKRRSLYAKKDIKVGDVFSSENIGSYRPGFGLSPKYWDAIIGKQSQRAIRKGDILIAEDLQS